jgi:hypothetical protein
VATAESALFPLFVLWLLAFAHLVRGTAGRGAAGCLAVGGCTAVLWTVHGRMIVVAAVTVLTLAVLAAGRLVRPVAAWPAWRWSRRGASCPAGWTRG